MKLCKVSYSDFVVWSNQQAMRWRIFFDAEFMESALTKVELFVKQCTLPELIGKWFSDPDSSSQEQEQEQQLDTRKHHYCFIRDSSATHTTLQCLSAKARQKT